MIDRLLPVWRRPWLCRVIIDKRTVYSIRQPDRIIDGVIIEGKQFAAMQVTHCTRWRFHTGEHRP